MKKPAVIYHRAHGHTEHIARRVAEGAGSDPATQARIITAEALRRLSAAS